jgi:hypothetical protein
VVRISGTRTIKVGGTVMEVTDDGVRKNSVFLADTLALSGRVRAVVFGSDGKPKANENAPLFRRIVKLAGNERRVWDALHFLTQHQSWANLYKVFEVVRDDVGDQVYELVESTKLRAFTGTAQSRRLIGDQARHASEKYPGPKNPLSIEEARQLIRQLVENWVRKHPNLEKESDRSI